MWTKHAISEPGPGPTTDGHRRHQRRRRVDFVNAYGWWSSPRSRAPPRYHPAAFGGGRGRARGAEIAVYDVNGDGSTTSSPRCRRTAGACHGSSRRRPRTAPARRRARHHGRLDQERGWGDLLATAWRDVRRHRRRRHPDFITGKRFWSHLDTFLDPDPHGAPVLYATAPCATHRPGGAEFVPELVHNRSVSGRTWPSPISTAMARWTSSPAPSWDVHLLEQVEGRGR